MFAWLPGPLETCSWPPPEVDAAVAPAGLQVVPAGTTTLTIWPVRHMESHWSQTQPAVTCPSSLILVV